MNQNTGRTALITGASAGLGSDLARFFAAEGDHVVLVARREDRLQELALQLTEEFSVKAHVCAVDLVRPDAAPTIWNFCQSRSIEVEYLVNNAGFGTCGAFAEMPLDRELEMIAVNIHALVHLTGLFVPGMVARGHGRVLNIGSTAGFQAGPYMATYYASKAFVNHFSEALWHEVAESGVSVTVCCPGPTATEFADISGNAKTKLFEGVVMTSESVARSAYKAMRAGRRMDIPGFRNRAMVGSQRLAPRSLVQKVVRRLNRA